MSKHGKQERDVAEELVHKALKVLVEKAEAKRLNMDMLMEEIFVAATHQMCLDSHTPVEFISRVVLLIASASGMVLDNLSFHLDAGLLGKRLTLKHLDIREASSTSETTH